MPKAYHHVFFTVREGLSDAEVIGTLRRYRDVAVSKGYIQRAEDISVGKVVIPAGGGRRSHEVAPAHRRLHVGGDHLL
jgi:hypothetical protein